MGNSAHDYPCLRWVAPRGGQRGLVRNKPWLLSACSRGLSLFTDRTLQMPATVLAAVHEAAIDYIEQAPALVVAATENSDLALLEHRERVTARFAICCEARPRLKELLRFYGVAPQLRRLSGSALRRNHFRLLNIVSEIPPSRLSQCIPADPAEQSAWLETTYQWHRHAARVTRDPDWLVAWAAANSCHRFPDAGIRELVDFAGRDRAAFDTRWNLPQAVAACERWHAEIANKAFSAGLSEDRLHEVADYGPLPLRATVSGHTFTALRSRAEIFAEGRAMHHCVATYAEDVLQGQCWIYSVKRDGAHAATLELSRSRTGFEISQLCAHCNRTPARQTVIAAELFVSAINTALDTLVVRRKL